MAGTINCYQPVGLYTRGPPSTSTKGTTSGLPGAQPVVCQEHNQWYAKSTTSGMPRAQPVVWQEHNLWSARSTTRALLFPNQIFCEDRIKAEPVRLPGSQLAAVEFMFF